jgi:hypothetical protein
VSETATTEQLPLLPTEAIRDATVSMSGGLSSPELFDRWLAEVKAQVWEEGLEAKFKRLEGDDSISLPNPYRGEK